MKGRGAQELKIDHDGRVCLGVWLRVTNVEGRLRLRGQVGRSREGLCEAVLAGQYRPQGSPWRGNHHAIILADLCVFTHMLLYTSFHSQGEL